MLITQEIPRESDIAPYFLTRIFNIQHPDQETAKNKDVKNFSFPICMHRLVSHWDEVKGIRTSFSFRYTVFFIKMKLFICVFFHFQTHSRSPAGNHLNPPPTIANFLRIPRDTEPLLDTGIRALIGQARSRDLNTGL